jgi:hypothetical protein
VSRALATGDIDNDGDLDLLVTNNGQTADLLRNDSVRGNSLLVRALVRTGNRDAIGGARARHGWRPNPGPRPSGWLELPRSERSPPALRAR